MNGKAGGAGAAWAGALRLGLRLGVTPEQFWRLSLKEWRMLTVAESAGAMTRGEFERLLVWSEQRSASSEQGDEGRGRLDAS